MDRMQEREFALTRLIKGQMAAKKISIVDLGKAVGASKNSLTVKLVNPGRLRLCELWAICDATGISREDLREVM